MVTCNCTAIDDGVACELFSGENLTASFTNKKIEPEMTIDKDVVSNPIVQPGGQVTYQIVVANTSTSDNATGVSIWDPLPNYFTYASTDAIICSYGADQTSDDSDFSDISNPVWGLFAIPAGGSVTITFIVDISNQAGPGTYENAAYAEGDCFGPIDDDPPVGHGGDEDTSEGDRAKDEDVTIPPTEPVGGNAYPINKVGLIAPWIALAMVITAGGIYLVRCRFNN